MSNIQLDRCHVFQEPSFVLLKILIENSIKSYSGFFYGLYKALQFRQVTSFFILKWEGGRYLLQILTSRNRKNQPIFKIFIPRGRKVGYYFLTMPIFFFTERCV